MIKVKYICTKDIWNDITLGKVYKAFPYGHSCLTDDIGFEYTSSMETILFKTNNGFELYDNVAYMVKDTSSNRTYFVGLNNSLGNGIEPSLGLSFVKWVVKNQGYYEKFELLKEYPHNPFKEGDLVCLRNDRYNIGDIVNGIILAKPMLFKGSQRVLGVDEATVMLQDKWVYPYSMLEKSRGKLMSVEDAHVKNPLISDAMKRHLLEHKGCPSGAIGTKGCTRTLPPLSTRLKEYDKYRIQGTDDTFVCIPLHEYQDAIRKIKVLEKDNVDYDHLVQWYIHSVGYKQTPIWTTAHISELLKDFEVRFKY